MTATDGDVQTPAPAPAQATRSAKGPLLLGVMLLWVLTYTACSILNGGHDHGACAGPTKAGALLVLQKSDFPLTDGVKVSLGKVAVDYTAVLTVGGADARTIPVRPGTTFALAGHRFEVSQICTGHVALLPRS